MTNYDPNNRATRAQWIDELIRWENANPPYRGSKEDSDSQRQLIKGDDHEH